ncbi:hypothetical protein ACF1BE_10930 [Streptomyces sp. NPDC014991]|uniref:hypothetical protein n=1 Tax=Streptomyces sp. NPDC014991 TaxID=3364935 RepID=UPI00370210E4
MSIRITARARRGVIALTIAVGMAVSVAGCGGGGSDDKKPADPASASRSGDSHASPQEGQSDEPLAELKGPSGLLLAITSAKRDSGGFITVNGNLKNDGGSTAVIPSNLSGNETEIIKNGSSLGGATLVDPKGKKRYYVLRDTDGRPLTTTGLPALRSGDTLPVFMQFPSPPTTTTEVDFQLPGFPTAALKISG